MTVPHRPQLTVVLMPGLGLDARVWAPVRPHLVPPATVVLRPSLGARSARGTDLRVEVQAQRLLDVLATGHPDPVVLVGYSASCPVAVEAARRSPQVVGLVVVGPVTDPRAATWPRILGQCLRTATQEKIREARVLLPQYRQTGGGSMVRGLDAVRRHRTDLAIATLDLPVVVVRGEHDRIAAQDWCRRLADLTCGRLHTVGGAAHTVPLTHPHSVAAAINYIANGFA